MTAPGWEGATVSSVCVQVAQHYPGIDPPPSEPISLATARIVEALGPSATTTPDEGRTCDATLAFDLTGEAIPGTYGGQRQYGGAAYQGTLTLTGTGRQLVTVDVQARGVQTMLYASRDAPRDAPWAAVWPGPVLQGLAAAFGPAAVVTALGAWPGPVAGLALSPAELDYVASVGEAAVDPLLSIRHDLHTATYERAYLALEHLVSVSAVAQTTQSRIVTAFIDDYAAAGPDSVPGDSLRGIWLARTPEYEEVPWSADPPGTLTPLWDADRWRQWATDTGFL